MLKDPLIARHVVSRPQTGPFACAWFALLAAATLGALSIAALLIDWSAMSLRVTSADPACHPIPLYCRRLPEYQRKLMPECSVPAKCNRKHNPLNPRRDVSGYGHGLEWTGAASFANGTLHLGILRTPLYHRKPESSPTVALSVFMYTATGQEAAESGVLVGHCGGPSSGALCGVILSRAAAATAKKDNAGNDMYFAIGISQRGVQIENAQAYDAASRAVLEAMPRLQCTHDTLKLPTPDPARWGKYRVSDFSSCSCALPDGSPAMGETWVDVDPSDAASVEGYLRRLQVRNTRCDGDPKWAMRGSDGARYNYLDYLGSNVLAHDLNLLRDALGVPKLSLSGISYGTGVGAAYGSIYRDELDRLKLDSNVLPSDPESKELAFGAARGLEQGVDKLLDMCVARRSRQYNHTECALGADPWAAFDALVAELRSPGLFAKAGGRDDLAPVRLGLGMVGGYLSTCMNLESWTTTCTNILVDLTSTDLARRQARVEEILDAFCVIPNATNATATVVTWRRYGVCIGGSHVGITLGRSDSFLDQTGIIGVDYYGRRSLKSAMRVYREALATFDYPATGAFLGWFGATFDWQVTPDPIRSGTLEKAKVGCKRARTTQLEPRLAPPLPPTRRCIREIDTLLEPSPPALSRY
jgi:pimeloyl-ACP methyl ester carboxylesterase